MSFSIEPYTPETHYDLFASWWKSKGWEAVPKKCLPPTGAVAYKEGLALAAGFLYLTDSSMMMLEYLTVNPDAGLLPRGKGLRLVVGHLLTEARSRTPDGIVYTYTANRAVKKMLMSSGMHKAEEGVTTLFATFGTLSTDFMEPA